MWDYWDGTFKAEGSGARPGRVPTTSSLRFSYSYSYSFLFLLL